MKKRLILLIALLAAAAALTAACLGGGRTMTAQVEAIGPTAQRDWMRASLSYDAGTRTLRGTQTLTAVNRTGAALEEAVLRLYMNGQDGCSAAVTGVTVDGQSASFAQDEDDPTVLRIALDWAEGQTVEIAFTVMIQHAKASGAAIVTLPALAAYEDGAWRTDAYDELAGQSYAQAFDYVIELSAKEETAAAFGGALTSAVCAEDGKTMRYTAQMQGARDVSLALCSGGAVRQKEIGGVLVTAIAPGSAAARELLSCAQAALTSLQKAGFAYPFPSLTVAQGSALSADGEALSGLAALAADGKQEETIRRLTRLAAQQTFGVLVESDPWNAPWLSKTLASTAELLAYRQRRGADAFSERFYGEIELATRLTRPHGVTVGAATAHFGGDSEMTQVLRDQGAAMMIGLEQAVGEEAFLAALQRYAQQSAGQIAKQDDLEAALLEATGSDWSGYLEDELAW